jgi:predicted RNA-binding Zn-ribbon protein involved in translation (DUF1610 family)
MSDEGSFKFTCPKCGYTVIVFGANNQKDAERLHKCAAVIR